MIIKTCFVHSTHPHSLQADYDSDTSGEVEMTSGKDSKHHNDLERKRRNLYNNLERKRRDVYKDNVKEMVKCIPDLQGKVRVWVGVVLGDTL